MEQEGNAKEESELGMKRSEEKGKRRRCLGRRGRWMGK
jgi:hypothetical protein